MKNIKTSNCNCEKYKIDCGYITTINGMIKVYVCSNCGKHFEIK